MKQLLGATYSSESPLCWGKRVGGACNLVLRPLIFPFTIAQFQLAEVKEPINLSSSVSNRHPLVFPHSSCLFHNE